MGWGRLALALAPGPAYGEDMPRLLLPLALLVAIAALMLPATASAKPVPWKSCAAPATYPAPAGSPAGKISNLQVKAATCAVAQTVTAAYTRCRLANGPTGRCVKRVNNGWACQEIRQTDPVGGISAQVTCSKDTKKVRHRYTQQPAA